MPDDVVAGPQVPAPTVVVGGGMVDAVVVVGDVAAGRTVLVEVPGPTVVVGGGGEVAGTVVVEGMGLPGARGEPADMAVTDALRTDLTTETAQRRAADLAGQVLFDAIAADLADERTARQAADLSLSSRVGQVETDLLATATALTVEAGTRTDADLALDVRVDTVEAVLPVKADLVGGLIPTSQIPAVATGQTVTVATEAAMLALTPAQVQPGDVAIRTDLAGRRFLLAAPEPSLLGSWIALEVPDAVSSVNTQQGMIVLGAADVGADPAGSAAAALAAAVQRGNHSGTQSLDTTTDSPTRLAMTPAERKQLADLRVTPI